MSGKPAPVQGFVDAFTSIRGVACMLVILHHDIGCHHKGNRSLEDAGDMSVLIFFVLSAYLLTRNILKEIVPDRTKEPRSILNMTLITYIVRRIFRVYPAFIVAVLLNYSFFKYYDGKPFDFEFGKVTEALLLQTVGNHLWTIRVEMAFYFIMLPTYAFLASTLMRVDYKHFRDSKFKTFYLLPLLCTILAIITVVHNGDHETLYRFHAELYRHYPFFWFGTLFGTFSFYLQPYKLNPQSRIHVGLCELSTYAILVFLYFSNYTIAKKYLDHTETAWWQYYGITSIVIALGLLILEKAGTNCSMGRFLSIPILVYMGKWSYSVYLIHMAAMQWLILHVKHLEEIDGSLIILMGGFFVGGILYNTVEEPCFNLSKPAVKHIGKYYNNIMAKYNKDAPIAVSGQVDQEGKENKKDLAVEINNTSPLIAKVETAL